MQSFNLEQVPTQENNNNDGMTDRVRNAAGTCLESCSAFLNTEMGQKIAAYTVVITVVCGAALIFGTAFKTASQVIINNKSDKTLYPTWVQPYGVKSNCGLLLFPETSCTLKFNGVNSYLNLETDGGGTVHVNTKCDASLRDGPSNKKVRSKGITFWNCYVDYDDTSSNSDQTYINNTLSDMKSNATYIDFSDRPHHYLRGADSANQDVMSDEMSSLTI